MIFAKRTAERAATAAGRELARVGFESEARVREAGGDWTYFR